MNGRAPLVLLRRAVFGRPSRRRRPARRVALILAAACCGGLALTQFASAYTEAVVPAAAGSGHGGSAVTAAASSSEASSRPRLEQVGHEIFLSSCAACHGLGAEGIGGRGPSLHGVGGAAAAFYLETGRMPLPSSREQPVERQPAFPEKQIRALIAYVGSFGGPAVPKVDLARGSTSKGEEIFSFDCAGCHTIQAQGGIVTGAVVPSLGKASMTQVGEAIRVGPYVMPRFGEGELSDTDVDSIARYVRTTQRPADLGGWGIGRIGPIPEGMVSWLLALGALLLIARVLGERMPEQPRQSAEAGASSRGRR
jgi:ubiquinol-cytochrome c reductase cytochrome c subunit